VISGGGPADLNLGTLIKRRQPATEVTIFEQNLADATFGFGVAFSDRAFGLLVDNASIRAVPILAPAGMESSVTSAASRPSKIDSESLAVLGNQRGQRCGVDDLAVHYNDGRVPSLGKISLVTASANSAGLIGESKPG